MTVERIDYRAGGVHGKGALIWNEKVSGKRPLLLIMPNWLGVTDNAIRRSISFARWHTNDAEHCHFLATTFWGHPSSTSSRKTWCSGALRARSPASGFISANPLS